MLAKAWPILLTPPCPSPDPLHLPGKTMLAKALAKQSGCFFLNISTSSILSKWLGDASRLVRAVFTLAEVRGWYSWCGV